MLQHIQTQNGSSHMATDQMRKTPINTAAADQARMKAGDCLDHHASSDLKRETPINGRTTAENTDTTLRNSKTAGNNDPAAVPQRARPNANRIADATHKPLLSSPRHRRPQRPRISGPCWVRIRQRQPREHTLVMAMLNKISLLSGCASPETPPEKYLGRNHAIAAI